MLDLEELEQLVAFADCGTLSKAAEALHISQPTLTRSMKHLEDEFGVPLFVRGKNKIELNDTGLKAVGYARTLLAEARGAVSSVRRFDKSLRTVTVESCAPAPLWTLLPRLAAALPEMAVTSEINRDGDIFASVSSCRCDIGITTAAPEGSALKAVPFLREALSVCVPPDHELAAKKSVTFAEINGYNFLLRSEIGFWGGIHHAKMPASKFFVQRDDLAFKELIQSSSLPCFTTNLVYDTREYLRGRRVIPITDPEAEVTYYLVYRAGEKKLHGVVKRLF